MLQESLKQLNSSADTKNHAKLPQGNFIIADQKFSQIREILICWRIRKKPFRLMGKSQNCKNSHRTQQEIAMFIIIIAFGLHIFFVIHLKNHANVESMSLRNP